jgi:predicted phage terminase large subunit-like protein
VHYEIADLIMDREIRQVEIQAPRGVGKSKINLFFILHHILFDEGDKVVVVQSKTRKEAVNRLTDIKEILNYNSVFKDLFGYAGEQVSTSWREDKIKTRINGCNISISALGTGQPVRGMLEGDTRITLYVLDDPDDEDNTLTKEQMDKNFDKFLGGIAGLDRRNGRVIVIGTPIRQGCIVDRLNESSGWATKRYQSIDENGNLLWEEMYPKGWLDNKKEELKEQGMLRKFYSEYQCEIVGEEDQLFKPEYIRYWDGQLVKDYLEITHIDGVELPAKKIVPVNVFLGIDPASSTKQTADYSVTMPIAYDGENIYVLPYFRKRVTPTAHAEQIIETIKLLKPLRAQVETVGYQEMMRQYLRQRLDEEGLWVGGLETKYNPRTEKSARLEALHPLFYNKRVYLKKEMTELYEELITYPRGRHDDAMDGLYYASRKLISPDHVVEGTGDDSKHWAFQFYNQKRNSWFKV